MSVIPADVPAAAEILGRAGAENFPVASLLFPRDVRPHLMSVYGFARLVDQLGDDAAGDRTALLDWLDGELNAIYGGGRPEHPLLRRLAWTVRARDLPRGPFDRLVLANRRDQSVSRYETFDDLLGYCDLSANPVGELVLLVVGAAGPHRIALSDRTCTGLQLVEFWQDLGEDAARGRVYVPLEDLARFDYSVEELTAGVRDRRFVALMAFEAERTRGLLAEGRALAATLRGRVRLAVRLFTAGGMAALDDLQRRGYDTFGSNAHASNARRAWFAAVELLGRGS
jgi:squalene synthase HpnC